MKQCKRILLLSAVLAVFSSHAALSADAPDPAKAWSSAMEALVPLGERMAEQMVDPGDAQSRQEMYRFLHEMMSQGYFALQYQDPKYPDFWPMFNQAYPYMFANPDDSYYQAVVEGSGVYRISGFRGTTRSVDFEIGSGEFVPYAKGSLGPTLKNYDLDHDVHVKKDGSFDVVLSTERPEGYKGDWWKLDPTATFIWVRQISYDWAKEMDGRFAIERLDVPAGKPRDSAERIAQGLQHLPAWTEGWAKFVLKWAARLRAQGLINKVAVHDLSSSGGISTQRYIEGTFDIQPDEALVLETEVPKECSYWAFQLTDELTNTIDWNNHQSTLNGFTAKKDRDGKFRAVISATDPGVPNWLDVADHQRGMIIGRWKECSSYPEPVITKVKLSEVRKYLPADTPVVTAEARDATIRARRKAVQLRRRW
jgi:hypothetical protein